MKIFACLPLAAIMIAAFPVMAQAPNPSAQIELFTPAPDKSFIVEGAIWRCEDKRCTTPRAPDMPIMRVCRRVVAVTGPALSFTLRGKAFDEAQLAQCNQAAKS